MTQEQIEKAAINYAKTNPFVNSRTAVTARESFKDGINYALSHQWIPFSADNAPCIGQEVLIKGETGDVMLAQIIKQPVGNGIGHVLTWHPEVRCKVTHWLPIPQLNPEKTTIMTDRKQTAQAAVRLLLNIFKDTMEPSVAGMLLHVKGSVNKGDMEPLLIALRSVRHNITEIINELEK